MQEIYWSMLATPVNKGEQIIRSGVRNSSKLSWENIFAKQTERRSQCLNNGTCYYY